MSEYLRPKSEIVIRTIASIGALTGSLTAPMNHFDSSPARSSVIEMPYMEGGNMAGSISDSEVSTSSELGVLPDIPLRAEKYIENNTIYFDGINCSGMLIRNQDTKVPMGVITAAHCGLRFSGQSTAYGSTWIEGGDGKQYIIQPYGIRAKNGDVMTPFSSNVNLVGEVTNFALPNKTNHDMDEAIGAFAGYSLQEVIDTYMQERLSREEIDNQQPGQAIYMGSMPWNQLGNEHGDKLRQSFKMTYLGQQSVSTVNGVTETVIEAVVDKDNDDALCGPGASGSVAFILRERQNSQGKTVKVPRPIGVLSVGVDLQPAYGEQPLSQQDQQAWVDYFKQKYPEYEHWDTAGAVCGITIETPNQTNGYTDVKVVKSASEIPDPLVNSTEVAENLFYSSKYASKVINGILIANIPGEGKVKDSEIAIERPIVFPNQDGSLAICYDMNGFFNCQVQPNTSGLTLYRFAPQTPISIIKSAGVEMMTNPNPQNYGSFVSTAGFAFGTLLHSVPSTETLGPSYHIENSNGSLKFNELQSDTSYQ